MNGNDSEAEFFNGEDEFQAWLEFWNNDAGEDMEPTSSVRNH